MTATISSSSHVAALLLPPQAPAMTNYEAVAQFIALSTTAMCDFYHLKDFNERSSPNSLEGVWVKALLDTAVENEVNHTALHFVNQLVLDARANQTISTEFLNENSYLYNRYDFDDALTIENESMEAFKLYFKGANSLNPSESYLIKLQYPTKWLLAIRDIETVEEKAQVIQAFLEEYKTGNFWEQAPGLGFCLQVETMTSRIDLPILKDVVSPFNIENKKLTYLYSVLDFMRTDVIKIQQLMALPSFSFYEQNRSIMPEIIQTTGYSLLTRPFTLHARALENIMAQRHVMEILKKSKYKN